MHELAVTESLLNLTLKHAATGGANRVTDLYLVIGQLSSVVDESVQFYWDIVSQGTIAEGAKLHFRRLPIEMHCLDCELDYRPKEDELACPECEGVRVRVMQGEEFHLEAIDVASPDELADPAADDAADAHADPAAGEPADAQTDPAAGGPADARSGETT